MLLVLDGTMEHIQNRLLKIFSWTPQRMREFILKLNILQSFNAQLLCCDTILTFNLKFLHDLLFLTSKKSAKFISFPGCALCSIIVKKSCPTLYCMLYNTILYLNQVPNSSFKLSGIWSTDSDQREELSTKVCQCLVKPHSGSGTVSRKK